MYTCVIDNMNSSLCSLSLNFTYVRIVEVSSKVHRLKALQSTTGLLLHYRSAPYDNDNNANIIIANNNNIVCILFGFCFFFRHAYRTIICNNNNNNKMAK